jgi:hypothetical protein
MSMQYSTDTSPMFRGDASLDLVVLHPVQPTVGSMQSLIETTPSFGGDASLNLVVSHHIQPMVEEVVMLMQFSVDLTFLILVLYLLYHVISISSIVHFEQEIFLLSLSALHPSPREVPFDWDGLVGYPMPPPMSFQVRDIIRYIMETITSTRTLSSLTWRALGFPKLMLAIRKILTFHRSSAWEPWPPP